MVFVEWPPVALMQSLSVMVWTSNMGNAILVAGAGGEENVIGGKPEDCGDGVDGGETLSVDVEVLRPVAPQGGAKFLPPSWFWLVSWVPGLLTSIPPAPVGAGFLPSYCGFVRGFAPRPTASVRL